jgi:hypothetical protein
MASFWDKIKQLFEAGEESSASNPAVHQLIERSEAEQADLLRWKETIVCKRLLNWLGDQYLLYRALPDDIDEAIDFLDTPSSKGFVIHLHKTGYSRRDATHLLDLFKEKVLALDYRTQVSDSRTYSRQAWVETVERHYLKPRLNRKSEGPLDQLFGNIMVELVLRDDKPHHLKFSATSYQDRLFREAEDFQDLVQAVLV